jgi:hypothetical protein
MSSNKFVYLFLLTLAAPAASATAQSFCDLLPAAVVQSTLGISTTLTATPNTEGGNGCDYKGAAVSPIIVMADTSDDTGTMTTMFTQHLGDPGPNGHRISGVGDAAYYLESHQQEIPRFPGVLFSKQVVVFRAKGKITSLVCTFQGNGVPKAAMLALANLTISRPINTLKNP